MNIETNSLVGNEELEKFYNKPFAFSYSGINKLLFSPSLFYSHYILNEREDSTDSHLLAGRVVHCLLLEPENFDKEFMVIPTSLPSGNNKNIVDQIFKVYTSNHSEDLNLEDFKDEIISYLEEINLHQSLKTDEQRLKKILSDQNESYFKFLKEKQGKTIVDNDIVNQATESVRVLKGDPEICELLQLNQDSELEVHNEMFLSAPLSGYPFGIKGVVDNVVIDKEKQIIFITDLKTTGKPLIDFADSVEFYKYWIQAAIYKRLIEDKFGINIGWKIVFTFLVIDKYNMYYPFQVTDTTMKLWEYNLNDILKQCNYHYESRDYTLPYKLAKRKVKL
jgi:hypothetical protein